MNASGDKALHGGARDWLAAAAAIALLLLALGYSLTIGRYPLSMAQVFRILVNTPLLQAVGYDNNTPWIVVELIRLPRVLLTCLCGAALGMSGAAMQGVFRNPLVGPEITGVSAAAAFGGVLGITFSLPPAAIVICAFACGMLASLGTIALVRLTPRAGAAGFVLVGVTLSTFFSALVGLLESLADPTTSLPNIIYWLLGGFGNANYQNVALAGIVVLVAGVPLILLSWRINLLSLSDMDARALGVPVATLRMVIITLVTLLVAAQVSVSGGVGWVGFVIPHLARMIVGAQHSRLLPISACLGALYLLLMDDLARSLSKQDLPISLLTASVGAPLFLLFFWRLQARGWASE